MDDFYRIKRLPSYLLAGVTDLKIKARARGEDIIEHRIRQAVRGIRTVLG